MILIDKIGQNIEYGKIGKNVMSVPDAPMPLQLQTGKLVKFSGMIAAVLFILVSIINRHDNDEPDESPRMLELSNGSTRVGLDYGVIK